MSFVSQSRSQKVIAALNEDKDQLVSGLEKRLDTQATRLDTLESQVKKLFVMVSKIRDYLNTKDNA